MKISKIVAAAAIAALLLPAYPAFAQWQEDDEEQRLEDQQGEDVLYRGSDTGTHDEAIHMPKKKRGWQPPEPIEQSGKAITPDEEIVGTSKE